MNRKRKLALVALDGPDTTAQVGRNLLPAVERGDVSEVTGLGHGSACTPAADGRIIACGFGGVRVILVGGMEMKSFSDLFLKWLVDFGTYVLYGLVGVGRFLFLFVVGLISDSGCLVLWVVLFVVVCVYW